MTGLHWPQERTQLLGTLPSPSKQSGKVWNGEQLVEQVFSPINIVFPLSFCNEKWGRLLKSILLVRGRTCVGNKAAFPLSSDLNTFFSCRFNACKDNSPFIFICKSWLCLIKQSRWAGICGWRYCILFWKGILFTPQHPAIFPASRGRIRVDQLDLFPGRLVFNVNTCSFHWPCAGRSCFAFYYSYAF